MTTHDKKSEFEENISVYPSSKTLIVLLCGAILMLFFAVFLFTRPAFISAFNLSDKGPIGDAINGITGPIIALISAGLLFYSFQAQLEANRRQLQANRLLKSQWEFDTYYRLFGEIEKAYNENLEMTVTSNGVDGKKVEKHIGAGYIRTFREDWLEFYIDDEDVHDFVMGHLSTIEFILEDLIILINYVRDSDVKQKHFFLYRIDRFYGTRLEREVTELYKVLPKDPAFRKYSDVYETLAHDIESIRKNELKHEFE